MLTARSDVIASLVSERKLKIASAMHDVSTSVVVWIAWQIGQDTKLPICRSDADEWICRLRNGHATARLGQSTV
jgi:hypothetical protein